MISETEEAEKEKEIPMYCCFTFSYAVYYKFITIDLERNSITIDLKSSMSLSEADKKEITDRLHTPEVRSRMGPSYIYPDYLEIAHCPWCGLHMNHVIDFDKTARVGQYSSKEDWER